MNSLQQLGTALFVATLSCTAAAQMPPPGEGSMPPAFHAHGMPPHLPPHLSTHLPPHLPPLPPSVRLSEAQQDKLFDIMHAAAPAWRDQMKAIRQANEALQKLASAEQIDEPAIRAAAEKLGQATVEMHLLRLRGERQFQAILTPEQRRQLNDGRQKSTETRGLPPHPARFADRQAPCEMPPPDSRKPAK